MMESPLRIALIGHIRFPIAPPFRGGMEVHAYHLGRQLVRRGHEVTLFASGDSHTDARLVPLISRHYDADLPWHDWHGTKRMNDMLDDAYASGFDHWISGEFDIVHNNSLHRYPPRLSRRNGIPMLTSLHVPAFGPLQRAVQDGMAPWSHVTACSKKHLASYWPFETPRYGHVVPNGIDENDWPFQSNGDGTAVWFGRITPTKGAHLAIDAAKRLGLRLQLFGTIEHEDYFTEEVVPRLSSDVIYGGHLNQSELAEKVGGASLFFFTPLWDEPFGLAAAEAMMCGVPVAALPNGASREVIGNGGVIATEATAEALAIASQRAVQLDRQYVASAARERFGVERMVDDYEALYRRVISSRPQTLPSDPHFPEIELPSQRKSTLARQVA